jgi:hypothetical protein
VYLRLQSSEKSESSFTNGGRGPNVASWRPKSIDLGGETSTDAEGGGEGGADTAREAEGVVEGREEREQEGRWTLNFNFLRTATGRRLKSTEPPTTAANPRGVVVVKLQAGGEPEAFERSLSTELTGSGSKGTERDLGVRAGVTDATFTFDSLGLQQL